MATRNQRKRYGLQLGRCAKVKASVKMTKQAHFQNVQKVMAVILGWRTTGKKEMFIFAYIAESAGNK